MAKQFTSPTTWAVEELRKARSIAEDAFRVQRRQEGPRAFAEIYREKGEPTVRQTLALTDDLNSLTAKTLSDNPKLWHTLRYFCSPVISEEDLWTFVGCKGKAMPLRAADAVAAVFSDVIDRTRFPWLDAKRKPTTHEREAAILATSVIHSMELLRTDRRGKSSARAQEEAVATALQVVGFQRTPTTKGNKGTKGNHIDVLDELDRGWFSRERKVAGIKCDVPIRLNDGRLLAIECKVSNGPKNSWKRLSREVGGKAQAWRERFGTQIVTGAVLAGVFDLSCLANAQEQDGVFLFWQHDLKPLADFVASAK